MKILVLGGSGAMGSEATRDLARTSDFDLITVGDIDAVRAGELCASLGGGRLEPLRVDVTDGAALAKLFERYDVVLNCTSYAHALVVTEAAIAAGRRLLDLGGLYNTPKQLAMHERAVAAGALIVLGMGATPGVTNLMARAGANQLDTVEAIHLAFASLRPIAPSPGLLTTVLDEFSPGTRRFYYQDGRHVEVFPFDGAKEITFAPPVGRLVTYLVPHSEIHTLPRFIPGLTRVDVRGTWSPPIMAALRHYNDVGLLGSEEMSAGGARIAPKDFLHAFYMARSEWPADGEWAFYLNVEIVGRRRGQPARVVYNLAHPPTSVWGKSATARVTGIPASIGSQRVAQGVSAGPGVYAPEAVFDPQQMFAELAKRDIVVSETQSTLPPTT